jgi:hypothetical protein
MADRRPIRTRPAMQHRTEPQRPDATEIERGAYNCAFSELGLEWYWDARTFEQLRTCNGDKHCIQAFIEANHPHLLQAYDGGSLATAIDHVRRRLSESAH